MKIENGVSEVHIYVALWNNSMYNMFSLNAFLQYSLSPY